MEEKLTNFTKPYAYLSRIYDLDWANFARQYPGIILPLLDGRGITKARILDLACGTGGLAIELAGYGHSVHGLDSSPEMVDLAIVKSMGMDNVSFAVQDMAGFQSDGIFDIITCTFDSINYLTQPERVQAMLRRVAAALDENGLFIFDSNTPNMYLNHHGESYRRELGGQSFAHSIRYDPANNEATTTFEFADGTIEAHRQRPYELAELEPWLNTAGLYIVYTFGDFNKRPYTPTNERLICITEKDMPE
jgi:SAM-dependent methyltransferase